MQPRFRSLFIHGLSVVLVAAFPYFLETWFSSIIDSVAYGGGQFPGWLPAFRSIGRTATVYLRVFDLLTYLIVPIIVFALGIHYAKTAPQ